MIALHSAGCAIMPSLRNKEPKMTPVHSGHCSQKNVISIFWTAKPPN